MFNIEYNTMPAVHHPVLAIHGTAGSGSQWQSLFNHGHYTQGFFAPDVQSRVDSQAQGAAFSERITPLLEWVESQCQPVHVVAHSFGCTLALEVAKACAQDICSLTFYEPVMPVLLKQSALEDDLCLLSELFGLSRIVEMTSNEVGMESFINYWHNDDIWSSLPESIKAKLAKQAPAVYADFRQAMNVAPLRTDYFASLIPLAIYYGSDTLPIAKRMATLLKNHFLFSSLTQVSGLGHNGIFTSSDMVNPLILEHLKRHDNSGC